MDLRQVKDKAAEAFTKGKFAKAGELYRDYCERDPKDHQAKLRMGDAWSKCGKREEAVRAYASAAEGFARDGFLPRAIAASKLVLELDPEHRQVQRMLADLYARKGGKPPAKAQASTPAPAPPSPPPVRESVIALEPVGEAVDNSEALPPELQLPPPPPPPAPQSDLERGRSAFSRFDELALDPGEFLSAFGGTAPVEPPSRPAARGPSLAQLEIEGDSLLHAIEAAAEVGCAERGEVAPSDDEPLLLIEVGAADEEEEEITPDALPHIPLFSDLPPDAFVELFERCPLQRLPQGERVIRQGSLGDAFYVVCAGTVRVLRQDGDGPEVELAALEEGAFFGEMAFLSGAPRSASVEATAEETQLLEISAPILTELSRKYPPVSVALKRFCRQRLLSNLMASAALFEPFTRSERRKLVERFRARDVAKGDPVLVEGSPSDGLYLVLSGEVEVTTGGRRLARLKEGDLFGEISLLTRSPATASVTPTRRTSLLRLPQEDFEQLIMTHPQVLAHLAELSERRQRANATPTAPLL